MRVRLLLFVLLLGKICATQEIPCQIGPIAIWEKERRLEVPAVVNMDHGLVELLATDSNGKKHESVLVMSCKPALLHTACGVIGLNPGGGGKYQGDTTPIYGDQIYIYVTWQSDNGQTSRVRGEDLIWDQKHDRPMPHTHWVFTGSRTGKNRSSGRTVFKGDQQGVLVATYYDPDAVINNPLPERTDDTVYCVNKKTVPLRGTKVNVIFTVVPYGE
jgi:hypothetical protein